MLRLPTRRPIRPPSQIRPKRGSNRATEERPRATSIAIISQPGGLKTLIIHFPWSLYPDSSIEVRLVPGPDAKGIEVAPIYFHEHLKGKVRDDFYDCLDHPENGGKSHNFTKDKLVYTMIGRLNSLGNQGVHVQVTSETPKSQTARPSPICSWTPGPSTKKRSRSIWPATNSPSRARSSSGSSVATRRFGMNRSAGRVQVGPFCRKGLFRGAKLKDVDVFEDFSRESSLSARGTYVSGPRSKYSA